MTISHMAIGESEPRIFLKYFAMDLEFQENLTMMTTMYVVNEISHPAFGRFEVKAMIADSIHQKRKCLKTKDSIIC